MIGFRRGSLKKMILLGFVFAHVSSCSYSHFGRLKSHLKEPPLTYCIEPNSSCLPGWVDLLQDDTLTEQDLKKLTEKPAQGDSACQREEYSFFRLKNKDKDLENLTSPLNVEKANQEEISSSFPQPNEALSSCFNIFCGGEREKQKEEIEKKVPLSRIENLYNELDGKTKGKQLLQFGYSIFKNPPTREILGPVDPNYLIGPQDEILIKSTGGFEIAETFTVDRDGSIFIPKIGAIAVGFKPFKEAKELIASHISSEFYNFVLDVSLGKLHSIQVTVTGYVQMPGLQTVPANANLMDILIASGGITKDGSLRKVVQMRAQKVLKTIDLYELLVKGEWQEDWQLLPGDRLHIPAIEQTAAICGPVNEGIYELLAATQLNELIRYAGGSNGFTLLETVLLERTVNKKTRKLFSLDLNTHLGFFPVEDSDVVELFAVSGDISNSVFLTGAVVRPGVFPFEPEMKVSDLLRLGEGFLLDASLESAVLERQLGVVSSYDQILGDGSAKVQQQIQIIDLSSLLCGDSSKDFSLRRLDKLKILTRKEIQEDPTVDLIGAVRRPGVYKLTSQMTLGELLKIAGGPTVDAYKGPSMLVRRSSSYDSRQYEVSLIPFNLEDVLKGGESSKILIHNLDQIVIKRVQTLNVKADISGAIRFPGTYVLPQGSRLFDLIKLAGSFQEFADLRGAIFIRKSVQNLQEGGIEQLFAATQERFVRARDYLTKSGEIREGVAGQLSLLSLPGLKKSTQYFQTRGRIVIDLLKEYFPQSCDNLVLEEGDHLYIPKKNQSVVVAGEVISPNAFVWNQNYTVRDYLARAGWFHEYANPEQTFIIQANGEVISASQFGLNSLLATNIGSGDIILVPPQELDRSKYTITKEVLTDVVEILKGFAEFNLINATIPAAGKRQAQVNIDTTESHPVYIPGGNAYDILIQQQGQPATNPILPDHRF